MKTPKVPKPTIVKRKHALPRFAAESEFDRNYEEWIQFLIEPLQNRSTQIIGTLLRQSYDRVVNALVLELPKAEIMKHIRLHHWFALANFVVGSGGDVGVNLTLNETTIYLPPERKRDFMGFEDWKRAFDICLLMRDMQGLAFLSNLSEEILKGSNQGMSEYDLAHFHFLAHFFTGGANTGALLVDAVEKSQKPQENSTRTKYVNLIHYPQLRLLQYIIEGDAEGFNKYLAEAIKDHKKYWETTSLRYSSNGWFSFALTALCAMAVDTKQFPITVESPFIPAWLIFREYE
ncbi:MAG: immunity 49 family protein [Candidatus Kapabacteria bacterium]|jgi:hypothetical protein|nr:immunity 49 family protein [Candidatus Kapabacteria bacterium]